MKFTKKQVRGSHIPHEVFIKLDSEKPYFSMMVLAQQIIINCFQGVYFFRSAHMEKRFTRHGVLPKSFFRQNFHRSKLLLELIEINNLTIDELLDSVTDVSSSTFLKKIELEDRGAIRAFYKLSSLSE